MGYYTYYNVKKVKGSNEDWNTFVDGVINTLDLSSHEYDRNNIYFTIHNGIKWYDYEDDVFRICSNLPDLIVDIYGCGEERDDVWIHRFCGEDDEIVHGRIVFDEFKNITE